MLKIVYRVLLTINAIILLVVVYLIKTEKSLPFHWLPSVHVSYFVYFTAAIIMSGVCLWFSRFLSDDIITGGITEAESANNSYLPSYLGYFFVALSINDCDTLIWVTGIVMVFTFFSQTLYFNPLFLIFGYKFYNVSTDNGVKFFIISKKNITTVNNLSFHKLKRINNYTFIDKGRY